jgi:two-component sensor histidine kinase/PAS domain-containing protein
MQCISETLDAPITGSLDTDDTDLAQTDHVAMPLGRDLLHVLRAMQEGDFSVRMAGGHDGLSGQIAEAVNLIATANQRIAQQLERIGDEVGGEGRIRQRIRFGLPGRGWCQMEDQLNRLIDNLLWPTTVVTQAVAAVARGDLTQTIALDIDGRPLTGDFLQSATIVNTMIRQLDVITAEITRVAREVGTEGRLGAQAEVHEADGVWKDVTESVNAVARSVTAQIRNIADVTAAVANGAFSKKMTAEARGETLQLKEAINAMVDQLCAVVTEVTRVVREVGAESRLGGQADVPGAAGAWKDLTDGVNHLAANLTAQPCETEADDLLAQSRQLAGELQVRQIALQLTAAELERRVAEGAAELERSKRRLQDSEDSRILALAAGKMGSWDWDLVKGHCLWDVGQTQIFGADPASFEVVLPGVRALVDRSDWKMLCRQLKRARQKGGAWQLEFRVRRPDGGVRWCLGTAVAVRDAAGRISRIRGITMDITERKESEDRQLLLAREVDHRTKNALAVVHAIVSLTRADDIEQFSAAVERRIHALARAHSLVSDSRWRGTKIADLIQGELTLFRTASPERIRISGRSLMLHPSAVQALALAVHELAANAARHGALSVPPGSLQVAWEQHGDELELRWTECGGPCPQSPVQAGLGMRIIKASVETQLCGSVAFDWRLDGLSCGIRVPCHPKSELFGNFLHSVQNPVAWRRISALS